MDHQKPKDKWGRFITQKSLVQMNSIWCYYGNYSMIQKGSEFNELINSDQIDASFWDSLNFVKRHIGNLKQRFDYKALKFYFL